MAILDEVPGVEVAVQIAGEDVVEYDDPEPPSNDNATYPISNKYIECIDGAEFRIRYKAGEQYNWGYKNHSLQFKVQVDGLYINAYILGESHLFNSHYINGRLSKDPHTSQVYLHRCKFSAITTVDDSRQERVKKDAKGSKLLGLIEVQVCRGISTPMTCPSDLSSPDKAAKTSKLEIAEKSLKGRAVSHGLTLSSKEKIKPTTWFQFRELPEDAGQPIAVFRFHYRSKESLKQELIIPRSPTNSPAPTISEMPRAELERLAQERLDQMHAKKHAKDEVKRESRTVIKREAGEIYDLTQEPASLQSAKRPKRETVVVDLTDD